MSFTRPFAVYSSQRSCVWNHEYCVLDVAVARVHDSRLGILGWPHPRTDEVAAREGDVLEGLSQEEGWWRVRHMGKVGLFPGNYIEVGVGATAG